MIKYEKGEMLTISGAYARLLSGVGKIITDMGSVVSLNKTGLYSDHIFHNETSGLKFKALSDSRLHYIAVEVKKQELKIPKWGTIWKKKGLRAEYPILTINRESICPVKIIDCRYDLESFYKTFEQVDIDQ